jgi:mono/diheme cytochrome c family protein
MKKQTRNRFGSFVLGVALVLSADAARAEGDSGTVDFNQDIRPIFAENCFPCHGPDAGKRKANLRLDTNEGALRDLGGRRALVPGKPDESELVARISSEDEDERMPPAKVGRRLTPRQIDRIRRWIAEGAEWKGHWSYLRLVRPPVPPADQSEFVRNPIDRFVLAKLDERGLRPSPEADRVTLIRRLRSDLTGLPPTPEEVDAFVRDRSPAAVEHVVDRLLGSPEFGERMALIWLDLVRYADTGGYHSDNHRDVFLYRDYVVKAFNQNKPFDQFTIEQLAGDLLPGASDEQEIASGYNRMLQTTEEGGAQPKEYLAKYAADRVRNAATVWLGTTMGCCECHNHKFDPFTTQDFYDFEAFFADLKELAVGRQEPMRMPSAEQSARLRPLDGRIAALRAVLDAATPELEAEQAEWERSRPAGDRLPKPIVTILTVAPDQRTAGQKSDLAAYYRTIAPRLAAARGEFKDLQRQRDQLNQEIPTTLIAIAVAPRPIRILPRGNWLDDSGPVVEPAVPAALAKLELGGRRATRLDLARWLVARGNPLVARVLVNRLWKLAFGRGIVATLDDFGSQGAWPTHPQLLDWLALEFLDSGWDVKRLLRLMVLSGAYRQSSWADSTRRRLDPDNRWLSRQARFRLDAEMVRDGALAVSGLLVEQIGGASVKPYQPRGYWAHLNFPKREYLHDPGANQYRRGLYTYWMRTFLHPSLLAFDAPTREECTVERPRSNTPLQALVLLNDPTYVEAARVLAERIVREGGAGVEPRIRWLVRQVLTRPARPPEVTLLQTLYRSHLEHFQADTHAVDELLHVGEKPAATDIAAPELAAWTSVARAVLNLHETITRN